MTDTTDPQATREALQQRIAVLKGKLKLGWRSGNSNDDGDALSAELNKLLTELDRFAAQNETTPPALGNDPVPEAGWLPPTDVAQLDNGEDR